MIPALLAPIVPLAKGILGYGALGSGTSVLVNQIPYLKKRNIKNAATEDEYNPATGKFRPGYEFDLGDRFKAIMGGYTKKDVLDARQKEFEKKTVDRFAGTKRELQGLYRDLGFEKSPRGLELMPFDDENSYASRLAGLQTKATKLEELQGILSGGQSLQNLGITPNSSTGSISAARKKVERDDPTSPYSLLLEERRQRKADEKKAEERRIEDMNRLDAQTKENTRRFELQRNDLLNQRRDDLLQQQKMFDFNMQQYNDRLDRQERLDRMEQRRLTGQAIGAAAQAIGGFF